MTTFVSVQPTALLQPRDRYRATWAVGAGASTVQGISLGLLQIPVERHLREIFEYRLSSTGLAIAASQPAVAPGDQSGTLDLRIVATLPSSGLTVAALASKLEEISGATGFHLSRLERLAGTQSQTEAERERAAVTADANKAAAAADPISRLLAGLTDTAKRAVYISAGLVTLYLLAPLILKKVASK